MGNHGVAEYRSRRAHQNKECHPVQTSTFSWAKITVFEHAFTGPLMYPFQWLMLSPTVITLILLVSA